MGALAFFRDVYNIDTLDTRFTNTSSTPYQTVIDARSDPAESKDPGGKWQGRSQRSKLTGPELSLHLFFGGVMIWATLWISSSASSPSDPLYSKYERYLSDGWILGRKIDNTDSQYRTFRKNIPYMTALLVFHPLLRKAWSSLYPAPVRSNGSASDRLDKRASFDYAFAILFLFILHGVSALKVLLILYINYQVATKLPRRNVPAATWIFNISILFANELCSGYHFKDIAGFLSPPIPMDGAPALLDSGLMRWGAWLDSYGGLMSRWHVLFNITILRLVSFNLDYYWSLDKRNSSSIEKKQLDPANLSERDRVSIPADFKDYSFRNYVAYVIYAPLYLAGPILTFNDYISQSKHRAASIERPRTMRYAVRLVICLLAMEMILHYIYIGAISTASHVWSDYSAAQLGMMSFASLHIIWLKLLLPWRLFRLWAVVDGIDPPENMVRCVSNNYSTQLFWRAWHRSYNRWLIRYIYGPLGGSSFRTWQTSVKSGVTYFLVFTFVALWHDIQMRLLIWGWLIVLFMAPEWIAKSMFPPHKWENRPVQYRYLCAAGAVVNVMMMISANLVGFAIGVDGMAAIIRSILHDWSGAFFITSASITLFFAIQIMFEVREAEKRKGVTVKC